MSDVPLWHILQTIMYYSLPCSRVCVSVCESVCVGMCKSECVCAGVFVSVSVRAWGYVCVYVSVRV